MIPREIRKRLLNLETTQILKVTSRPRKEPPAELYDKESLLETVRKMHGPSRRTLLANARNKVKEVNYQSYLQRCLALNYSSSQYQKYLISSNAYDLKSVLNIITSKV